MKKSSLRVYIHIPFCIRKCNYCSFVSYTGYGNDTYEVYIDYIEKELRLYKEELERPPVTLYIGGGTPSLLSSSSIYKLKEILKEYIEINSLKEFTIEANPESVSEDKVSSWEKLGINRVSLGVQSFDDKILSFLGRPHTAQITRYAISLLKDSFYNLSFDLIYGIPGQDIESWKETLSEAVSYGPQHISIYSLSIDEGTPLFEKVKTGEISPLEEELIVEMYRIGVEFLRAYGYRRYEISNFSKPQMESLHNLGYWNYEDYIGIGVSASSFVKGKRYTNFNTLNMYMQALDKEKLPIMEYDIIGKATKISEYAILRLRTEKGLLDSEFYALFDSYPYEVFKEEFDYFLSLGLIKRTPYGWVLTEKGIPVSNRIFLEILR